MYSWVSTEFRRHGIPLSTQNSPVDTEFPPSTQNSPLDTEFPPRHGIPPIFFTSIYSVHCAMLFIFLPNSDGIPWNSVEFRGFSEPISTIYMNLSILSVIL
jgi:hypothetical protein